MQKILIIEDEEALLSMLSSKLTREGYKVVTARDGEEGFLKVKEERPDLVLLDIVMPKMSGMEVLERMYADKGLSKIPVIIVSNSGQPVEIGKAKTLGAKDYLVKAEFDPAEVIEKVQKVLNNPMPEEDGPSILVVEDDQFLRDLIVKKLKEEGFSVKEAVDGEEGLRFVRENRPDCVLLDLILPGIDGFEVLKQVKADTSLSSIPVVILSNLGQKDDIDRGLELGAKDYLIKAHFTPGEIVQKVKEILG